MRTRTACPAVLSCALIGVIMLSGCGVRASDVEEGPEAPTGLAPGVTLYFLDDAEHLIPRQRESGHLGSISDAVGLLLAGPGGSGLSTGIDETTVTRVGTSVRSEVVELHLPLPRDQVESTGADQIVCTAAATHIQAGGSPDVQIQLRFTDVIEEPSSCPVL
ncbi:hypothetical protein [Nocardiopsis xinjiangensis]|uniref:hypothetical protein n=1 Tax=Nocardiopsis xinjiangensis TaxID=124285 RepID=UPI0009FBB57B|nr:hypothetical protein [Nocardiopsis xinjiangensis]